MSRIIGDRKEKSALDEMEEVARQFNEEVAEEERQGKAKTGKEKESPATENPVIVPAGNIISVSYNGLDFEAAAPRDGAQKALLTYDASLARIKAGGYERHALPSEAFSLIADNLEGKLKGNLKAEADDMLSSYGEWLSMAVERKGDILICYMHPEGLVWNSKKSKYEQNSFKCDGRQEFNISGKKSQEWISLDKFDDDFVKLFYGRSFDGLPKEMRQGSGKAHVALPADGELWPVGRNYFDSRFYVYGYGYYYGASRGVRSPQGAGGL